MQSQHRSLKACQLFCCCTLPSAEHSHLPVNGAAKKRSAVLALLAGIRGGDVALPVAVSRRSLGPRGQVALGCLGQAAPDLRLASLGRHNGACALLLGKRKGSPRCSSAIRLLSSSVAGVAIDGPLGLTSACTATYPNSSQH